MKKGKKKRGINKFIILASIFVAAAGIIFLFPELLNEKSKDEETNQGLTEEVKNQIKDETKQFMEEYLDIIIEIGLAGKGDISSFISEDVRGEITKISVPEDWVYVDDSFISSQEIIDRNSVKIEITYFRNEVEDNKRTIFTYFLDKEGDKWFITAQDTRKLDHDIILWPIIQDPYELDDIQSALPKEEKYLWRLDPLETARRESPDFGFEENDKFELITDKYVWSPPDGTYKAIVSAEHENITYYIMLTQVFTKGTRGVWSIKAISPDQGEL